MKQKLIIFSLVIAAAAGFLLVSQPVYALDCAILPEEFCNNADNGGDVENSAIFLILKWVIGIMSALVGVVAVGMFIWAGIVYSTGNGDEARVKTAKTLMLNTTIGIVAYGLMFLALNWLIPGGIFN